MVRSRKFLVANPIKCKEPAVYASNRATCRDCILKDMHLKTDWDGAAHRACQRWVSQAFIRLLTDSHVYQPDGRPYVQSTPKGFLQHPELWLSTRQHQIVGLPMGLPQGSISIWPAAVIFSVATMLINDTIRIVPLGHELGKRKRPEISPDVAETASDRHPRKRMPRDAMKEVSDDANVEYPAIRTHTETPPHCLEGSLESKEERRARRCDKRVNMRSQAAEQLNKDKVVEIIEISSDAPTGLQASPESRKESKKERHARRRAKRKLLKQNGAVTQRAAEQPETPFEFLIGRDVQSKEARRAERELLQQNEAVTEGVAKQPEESFELIAEKAQNRSQNANTSRRDPAKRRLDIVMDLDVTPKPQVGTPESKEERRARHSVAKLQKHLRSGGTPAPTNNPAEHVVAAVAKNSIAIKHNPPYAPADGKQAHRARRRSQKSQKQHEIQLEASTSKHCLNPRAALCGFSALFPFPDGIDLDTVELDDLLN